LKAKVAAVEFNGSLSAALREALDLIGGTDSLNTAETSVVVKVGVFSHKAGNHASVELVDAITQHFDRVFRVYLAESDNYQGTGLERLAVWKELFTDRIAPVSLSDAQDTRRVRLAGQDMDLANVLFKPNVLVSTHILRSFESGSILKNLFGCIPTSKKRKYHKVLPALLADLYEAVGGVDLAVLDGTYLWQGAGNAPVRVNTLLVGRDAVAVESVGATLAGLDPTNMPVLQEFVSRDLGEGDLTCIEILGAPFERLQKKFTIAIAAQKKAQAKLKGPQTWGGHAHHALESLIREGFFALPNKRTMGDVVNALQAKGLSTAGKEAKIEASLARRVRSDVLRKDRTQMGWVYWAELYQTSR
jgi:uncharacterized protein (DUF362 family)